MSTLESALFSIRDIDLLAIQDTPIHRRDPRAKLIVALVFVVIVVSYDKYALSALIPLVLYPIVLSILGNLPPRYLLGKILLVSPFALILGFFNPLLDRAVTLELGSVDITGGWVSYASILLRFLLTVSAALILVSTTGFTAVCRAMALLKVPRILTLQCLLLFRYIFVLASETAQMHKAWSLRSFSSKRIPLKILGSLAGHSLLRSFDRAERIHMAMLSRGFTGEINVSHRFLFGIPDLLFVLGWTAFFLLARCYNLPVLLGQTVIGLLS